MSSARDVLLEGPARRVGAATLLDRLAAVELRLRGLVPGAGRLEEQPWVPDDSTQHGDRLADLVDRFALDPEDLDVLAAVAAPDVDIRLARLVAVLHGDPVRQHVSPVLALQAAGQSALLAEDRTRADEDSALRAGGLVVADLDPAGHVRLRVPERVLAWVLGSDLPSTRLAHFVVPLPALPGATADALLAVLASGRACVRLVEEPGALGAAQAAAALGAAGLGALHIDLGAALPQDDVAALVQEALREARLQEAGLVVGPVDVLVQRAPDVLRGLGRAGWPVVLTGARSGSTTSWPAPVDLVVPAASPVERTALWDVLLGGAPPRTLELVGHLRQDTASLVRAALRAASTAGPEGDPDAEDLARACRAGAGAEGAARSVEPRARWTDLVLPDVVDDALHALADRVRTRDQVRRWGVGGGGAARRGVVSLFCGPPGTGKTLAAEVLAAELSLSLHVVDLSRVVDKYVGETEKALERLFAGESEARLLFFDEADALFGRRSEIRDSHDRYANLQTAYLLQRLEDFDGIAVLATNLRTNVDEAFCRRLDAIIEFPAPDAAARLRLWDRCLGPDLPRGADLDLVGLATAVDLSGGEIRNAAVSAAHEAAAAGAVMTQGALVRAVQHEYRKAGRLGVPELAS